MGDLAAELKKLNLVEIQKTIEKGTIVVLKDDEAEKFIKDKNNKTPYFVTTQFRENNLKKFGNSANEHYWIFLKTYQKEEAQEKLKLLIAQVCEKIPQTESPRIFISYHTRLLTLITTGAE